MPSYHYLEVCQIKFTDDNTALFVCQIFKKANQYLSKRAVHLVLLFRLLKTKTAYMRFFCKLLLFQANKKAALIWGLFFLFRIVRFLSFLSLFSVLPFFVRPSYTHSFVYLLWYYYITMFKKIICPMDSIWTHGACFL